MSLSTNIKKYRLEKGLTQDELASILGVSAQAVSKWETSETYPDGSLLVPLAGALDVSLDTLFDNSTASMNEFFEKFRNLFASRQENKFHTMRELCWLMEKSMFRRFDPFHGRGYDPDELSGKMNPSYILNDDGFTHVSNGRAPFFCVFPEYDEKFSEVIGDGEEMRCIFEALSSPESMRAVLFVYGKEENFVFEKEYLADVCGIGEDKIDRVMEDLASLGIIYPDELEIDGEKRVLFHTKPSHLIIALFLLAHELNYIGGYSYQVHYRSKPFLK